MQLNAPSFKSLVLISIASASFAAPVWAASAEDCQRAIDEVSVKGRANYDSTTEAEMTKYLGAANTFLMQNQKTQALGELKAYQQKLADAVKMQKVTQGNNAVLTEHLNKAMKCVEGLK